MATSASPAPSQGTSESTPKTLLLVAVVFLAVTGGSFVFFRNTPPEAAATPRPRSLETQVAAPAETPRDLLPEKQPPPAPAAAARDDRKAQNGLQRERLLENVGSVSSMYLYQTYLNVGLLADAVKNDSYTKAEAAELLGTIMTLLQTADAQMQKLENVGLDEEEVAAVKQVRKISALLKSQASHLQTFWKSGGQSSLDQFRQVRAESWTELRSILGLAGQNPAKAE